MEHTYVEYFSLAAFPIALNINLKKCSRMWRSMDFGVTENSLTYASRGKKLNRTQCFFTRYGFKTTCDFTLIAAQVNAKW